MLYKATISFCGIVNATKDEIIEIKDRAIAEDLKEAGYIVPADKNEVKNDENDGDNT